MTRAALLALAAAACSTPQRWETDEAAAFERARADHALVLAHFYASWAMQSVELERELRGADLEGFVPLRVDVSDQDEPYGAHALELVILDERGRVLDRIARGPDAADLTAHLAAIRSATRR